MAAITSEALNLIEGPLAVAIDNFADQAWSIVEIINRLKKPDVVFFGAEREYRWSYIRTALTNAIAERVQGHPITAAEAEALVDLYQTLGVVGSAEALANKKAFARQILTDPIAVGCCRILNNFSPLDRIVQTVIAAATPVAKKRYLVAAVAHHALRGGVRFEVLAAVGGRDGWDDQFEAAHPLPLSYFEGSDNSFVVPLNGSIAGRVISYASHNDAALLLDVFVALANAIAPRVNRRAIMNRVPEARLAGRLFDYDQIVIEFLKGNAEEFYRRTKTAWQWNSRYWEQIALMRLAEFFKAESADLKAQFLTAAIGHARHAVSIERHPQPMTTLGKILTASFGQPGVPPVATYEEAYVLLTEAILKEGGNSRRANAHAYIGLFRSTVEFIRIGGLPTLAQRDHIRSLLAVATTLFRGDQDVESLMREVKAAM